ncbi:carboxyl-terminal domain (ctd) phosphatase-like2 [Striga asiatica]|uniref:Carboxyl-terminal domain (Ctd) phosphatase-like2 n=1 Tax=Striga asiatica TaxID=4170 RepID=A0A5A7PJX0_STRAF|nr:carboxyl-terminal domain (ctd) phosphatase-like2 [Striga asiatica]
MPTMASGGTDIAHSIRTGDGHTGGGRDGHGSSHAFIAAGFSLQMSGSKPDQPGSGGVPNDDGVIQNDTPVVVMAAEVVSAAVAVVAGVLLPKQTFPPPPCKLGPPQMRDLAPSIVLSVD